MKKVGQIGVVFYCPLALLLVLGLLASFSLAVLVKPDEYLRRVGASSSVGLGDEQNCRSLATELSQKYRQPAYTTTTNSSSSLSQYFIESGVLFTMCTLDWYCGASFQQDHLAASWMQREATGRQARFFGTLGLVLNATVLLEQHQDDQDAILCAYPTDALTDNRPDHGCGGHFRPPNFFYRLQFKWFLEKYKNDNFGPDRPWSTIDCREFPFFFPNASDFTDDDDDDGNGHPSDFFPIPGGNVVWQTQDCSDTLNTSAYTYKSAFALIKEYYDVIMGHTVCHLRPEDAEPNLNDTEHHYSWWMYDGSCVWPPTVAGWQRLLQTMAFLRQTYPAVALWNEIVLRKPKRRGWRRHDDDKNDHRYRYRDLVSAVFYTDRSFAWRARLEARLMGHKHVLRLVDGGQDEDGQDEDDDIDLFQCAYSSFAMEEKEETTILIQE